jgi:rod shape-determining protein MreD
MLTIIQNIISFILLVLVQVLALNNIQFLGYINPYIYILFIISLPTRLQPWITLILAFILGLTIDIFSNTMGTHAFATVLIAFIRTPIIKLFASIEEGVNPVPSFYSFGVGAYIRYVIVMVLVHHTSLFFIEAFSFTNVWIVFTKVILSSLVSIFLLLGIRSFYKK